MHKLETQSVVLSVALILLISIAFWNGEKKAPALTADAALHRERHLQGEEYAFLSGIESDRGVHIVSPKAWFLCDWRPYSTRDWRLFSNRTGICGWNQ